MTVRVPDSVRNVVVDAVVDLLDAGAAAGTIKVYSGAQPADADDAAAGTLLATFTLSDPAFGAAAAGTAAAAAIASVNASATGTAGWFRAADSDGDTVLDGSVSASGGGGDLELNTTSLVAAASVEITALNVTMGAG